MAKFLFVLILLAAGIFAYFYLQNHSSQKLDSFASCLKDKGAIFYGAFWCPHCQSQKKLFGSSEKNLPYIECSTPNGKEQTQECKDKNITGYPTWEFSGGEKVSGELKLEELSKKTNCQLP